MDTLYKYSTSFSKVMLSVVVCYPLDNGIYKTWAISTTTAFWNNDTSIRLHLLIRGFDDQFNQDALLKP